MGEGSWDVSEVGSFRLRAACVVRSIASACAKMSLREQAYFLGVCVLLAAIVLVGVGYKPLEHTPPLF